jgi:hypothetical protein
MLTVLCASPYYSNNKETAVRVILTLQGTVYCVRKQWIDLSGIKWVDSNPHTVKYLKIQNYKNCQEGFSEAVKTWLSHSLMLNTTNEKAEPVFDRFNDSVKDPWS